MSRAEDVLAQVVAEARSLGIDAVHLVGGPVRDGLLGRSLDETKDLDVVLEGDAPELGQRLTDRHGGKLVIHERFLTATWVPPAAPLSLDLVTARRESYPQGGALPDVTPANLEEDLRRRDFTVNSIARSLGPSGTGTLHDPMDGVKDLRRGVLRIHHEHSYEDDPTRLFRAARYSVRLQLTEDHGSRSRREQAVLAGVLPTVSAERLHHEWQRTCEEAALPAVLRVLLDWGVLGAITGAPVRSSTNVDETPGPSDPLLTLATLDAGDRVARALGLSGRTLRRVERLVVVRDEIAPRLHGGLSPTELDQLLHATEALDRDLLRRCGPRCREGVDRYVSQVLDRAPLLDGRDLIALGVPTGPGLGRLLALLREAQLSGEIDDAEAARAFVLGLSPQRLT